MPTYATIHPIVARWKRGKHDQELQANYDKANGRVASTKFRSEWACELYTEFVKPRTEIQRKVQEEETVTTFLPLGRIAWLQGGGPEELEDAIQNAIN